MSHWIGPELPTKIILESSSGEITEIELCFFKELISFDIHVTKSGKSEIEMDRIGFELWNDQADALCKAIVSGRDMYARQRAVEEEQWEVL